MCISIFSLPVGKVDVKLYQKYKVREDNGSQIINLSNWIVMGVSPAGNKKGVKFGNYSDRITVVEYRPRCIVQTWFWRENETEERENPCLPMKYVRYGNEPS